MLGFKGVSFLQRLQEFHKRPMNNIIGLFIQGG